MKFDRIWLIGLTVALVASIYYLNELREDNKALLDKVAALQASGATLDARLADLVNNTTKRLNAADERVTALGRVATADEVAGALTETHLATLVEAQKKATLADEAAVDALRGPQGDPADVALVAAAIVAEEEALLVDQVVAALSFRFSETALLNAALIAAVAEAVVAEYGDDLRPNAASALEIAEELANNDAFASLVALYEVPDTTTE